MFSPQLCHTFATYFFVLRLNVSHKAMMGILAHPALVLFYLSIIIYCMYSVLFNQSIMHFFFLCALN